MYSQVQDIETVNTETDEMKEVVAETSINEKLTVETIEQPLELQLPESSTCSNSSNSTFRKLKEIRELMDNSFYENSMDDDDCEAAIEELLAEIDNEELTTETSLNGSLLEFGLNNPLFSDNIITELPEIKTNELYTFESELPYPFKYKNDEIYQLEMEMVTHPTTNNQKSEEEAQEDHLALASYYKELDEKNKEWQDLVNKFTSEYLPNADVDEENVGRKMGEYIVKELQQIKNEMKDVDEIKQLKESIDNINLVEIEKLEIQMNEVENKILLVDAKIIISESKITTVETKIKYMKELLPWEMSDYENELTDEIDNRKQLQQEMDELKVKYDQLVDSKKNLEEMANEESENDETEEDDETKEDDETEEDEMKAENTEIYKMDDVYEQKYNSTEYDLEDFYLEEDEYFVKYDFEEEYATDDADESDTEEDAEEDTEVDTEEDTKVGTEEDTEVEMEVDMEVDTEEDTAVETESDECENAEKLDEIEQKE